MKKPKWKIIILIILFATISSFIYFAYWDVTYHGKVIDADTKEPIKGAVVVISWNEVRAAVPHPHTRFKDVKETLTDKNGKWKIRGPRGIEGGGFLVGDILMVYTLLTGKFVTEPPLFIIFKPGYCSWSVSAFGIDACKEKLRPYGIGRGETAKLPKLTRREDRLRALPSPVDGEGAWEKEKEFIRMINEESRNLGLKGSYKIYEE